MTEAPLECGHKEWALGCERCFYEMNGLAKGEARIANTSAQLSGAILFNWHVIMVLQSIEHQLEPMTRSLELGQVTLAKNLIANLQSIEDHLVKLVQDSQKLTAVLAQAAAFSAKIEEELAKEKEQEQATPTPSVMLTDA